jgi:NRPS condensation-like uncharacterized protein
MMQNVPASALDLFTDSVRLMGDATIVAVLEFQGRLDEERMERSLYRLFRAYPILSSRLVRGSGPAHWAYGPPSEDTNLEIISIGQEDHLDHMVYDVDPHRSPQLRVRLLRRDVGDILVLNMSHAAGDATALKVLTRSLLDDYLGHKVLIEDHTGLGPRDTSWTRGLVGKRSPVVRTEMETMDPMWPSLCPPTDAGWSMHRAKVSQTDLISAKQTAHRLFGTLNDVLIASFFLALSDLTGRNGPQNIFMPVDLRRHLRDQRRMVSNQSGNVCLVLDRRPDEGMQEILSQVISRTKALKADGIGLKEQIEFDESCDPEGRNVQAMVEKMWAMRDQGLADVFFSNPGQFDLPDMSGLMDAYICYPGSFLPTMCFVVSTFRGEVSISIGYQRSKEGKDATRRALDRFLFHIRSAGRIDEA